MENFGFGDAISFMESGFTVCLQIDDKLRKYYLSSDGNIYCNISGSHVTYPVTKFYTDAVLSKAWSLDESQESGFVHGL